MRATTTKCTHEPKARPPFAGWRETIPMEAMCDCSYTHLKADCALIDRADCDPRLLHGMLSRAQELGFSRADCTRILKAAVRLSKRDDFVLSMHHWMWDNFSPYSATYVLRGQIGRR